MRPGTYRRVSAGTTSCLTDQFLTLSDQGQDGATTFWVGRGSSARVTPRHRMIPMNKLFVLLVSVFGVATYPFHSRSTVRVLIGGNEYSNGAPERSPLGSAFLQRTARHSTLGSIASLGRRVNSVRHARLISAGASQKSPHIAKLRLHVGAYGHPGVFHKKPPCACLPHFAEQQQRQSND